MSARLLPSAAELIEAIGGKGVEIDGQYIRITSSFGLAVRNDHHKTLEKILDDADKALYEAKRTGRNKAANDTEMR
jgi:diguanylate cyclase (GGDEF)-like protein